MSSLLAPAHHADHDGEDPLFARIAQELAASGLSVVANALPEALGAALFQQVQALKREDFTPAGVGRQSDYTRNIFVRRDKIRWIEGATEAERLWQQWLGRLQGYLNRKLFLGLFSVESHFAHYHPGDFYRKHLDAFKGEANRRLSIVCYLNPGWQPDDGGQLVIYSSANDEVLLRITPSYGTLAIFLSEDFPHEVLPANRHRYSIAGWFRINTSIGTTLDPPQ